ncbi:hypothetical protein QWJ34_12210 [Saccharibacillus sp. CPCC 101409]|uniref:hypothetical protein n=1 Tax=Saccharibacillus sp. CPCC 101409 TaxID=3058041 RepID=UPI0026717A19|nr:hypothetical protein [Saccharibacillus sp. CPCC 101409]MDO3410526.1 hypothetical protein [Saccharibacillus sp. CPCC 101409]
MKKSKRIATYCACAAGLTLLFGIGVPTAKYGTDTALAMAKLNVTDASLVPLESARRFDFYLAKDRQAVNELQALMSDRGWTFEEQNGSGYFFRKGGEQTVVTTKQLSRHTVRIQMDKDI